MKYKNGNSWYDETTNSFKYLPRIYTDFYCSLSEWEKLGPNGKPNFMYQVRSAIVDILGYPEIMYEKENDDTVWATGGKFCLKNGLEVNKLSLDRHGRRDSMIGEKYSAWIIQNVIKLITHRNSEVEYYSWKGELDHIEISFPDCKMPNIILLVDENTGSTNQTLISCIDAIYKTLHDKTTEWYDKYLYKFYNSDWDRIFYVSKEDAYYKYINWKHLYKWADLFKMKSKRIYDGISISYEK